ncbi:hypothetical protein, variant [Aphanomyces invadans]|uniref:Crossover junction endonuclease MUS81 n=1 Tax=Aphanomyces invadans TaxID=157072 RepID=A0A024UDM9_9STRA|nr:hypothetical protein, variant [Aphanomyces invadans]ETW04369.1 hypothetical protein, variant [Aphanomyces invadans]|eukprot:XP_008867325.1 hypothetical protein, variant [Aphanomyces invadans]
MPRQCVHPGNELLVLEMEKIIEQEAAKSNRRVGPGQVNHKLSSYQRALTSIRNHPEVIQSSAQAKSLRGVGNFIAQKIHAILIRLETVATYSEDLNRHPPPDNAQRQQTSASKKRKVTPSTTHPEDPPNCDLSKVYKPTKGKLPWYVIMALWAIGATSASRAVDLSTMVTEMKHLGFEGTTTQLSARLSGLISIQEVVAKTADSALYYLSLNGIRSVMACVTATPAEPRTTAADGPPPFDWSSTNLSGLVCSSRPVEPNPGDDLWEIVLLLDHREMISRTNRSVFERKLLEANVACEVRSLNIGDMIWIARSPTRLLNGKPEEYVLEVVVERKNVSDLASSIMDKRYTEQKARLKQTGLRYVIYLVEGSFESQSTCIRSGGLQTAMTRTQLPSIDTSSMHSTRRWGVRTPGQRLGCFRRCRVRSTTLPKSCRRRGSHTASSKRLRAKKRYSPWARSTK